MAIAVASRSRVAYVAETAFGTTPATPAFIEIRRTNGNLRTKKGTQVSDEMHLDRNVRDELQLAQDVTGSYDFELSYGTFDDILAAALQGTWATDVLTNGQTEQSFTFEETVDQGGGSFTYNRLLGCEVNSLTLNVPARKIVTGTVDIMGKQEAQDVAIIAGATYTAPNTNIIEVANSIANLSVAGLAPTPIVKNLTLNIGNNLRIRERIGSLYADSFGSGQMDITGSMDVYFSSDALSAAVLAHGSGALSFTIGAVTLKKYTISLPVIRFLDGARKIGGKNDDVMVQVNFRAIYDGSKSISIARAVA